MQDIEKPDLLHRITQNVDGDSGFFVHEEMPAGDSRDTDREVCSQHNSRKHAAELLGLTASASEAEIKQAYRTKCKEMHPDVLRSKGLPDELISYAGAQVQSFKEARDTLLAKV